MTAVDLQRLEEQLPGTASVHMCEVTFTHDVYTLVYQASVSQRDQSADTRYRVWIQLVCSHPAVSQLPICNLCVLWA